MPLKETTRSRIKDGFTSLYEEHKKHTDCDWIFDDVRGDIEKAIKNKISLSKIVAVIANASSYSIGDKQIKITTAKLAKWLKTNGIRRTIHRKKTAQKKSSE